MVLYTFRKAQEKIKLFCIERNIHGLSQRCFARTVAFSSSHDIRTTTGLIVALSSAVHCYLLFKQQKVLHIPYICFLVFDVLR